MTPSQLAVRAALYALADGKPLHDELFDVLADQEGGGLPDQARVAAKASQSGSLRGALDALETLGLDPLVARAAMKEPKAAVDVDRRLRALPATASLLQSPLGMLTYCALLACVQGAVAVVVGLYVAPVFIKYSADFHLRAPSSLALLSSVCVPWSVASTVGVMAVGVVWLSRRSIAARLLPDHGLGRSVAAAAALAKHGVSPADAARALVGDDRWSLLIQSADLGAGTLDELAAVFLDRAARRAARLALLVRVVATAVMVSSSFFLVYAVYNAIFTLDRGVLLQ